jgi:transcriptional regulator with XRE-family HTH domain
MTDRRTLREWREARALSLEELARAAGVHHDTVWQVETGRRRPHPRTRRRLAEALGVPPDAIAWPQRPANRVTPCGYCGAIVSVDAAYAHLREHLGTTQIVVDVANMTPRLARHVPDGRGGTTVEYADPQPPERVLVAAVRRAGGALNQSGIYPPSPSIVRWVARRAPVWTGHKEGGAP